MAKAIAGTFVFNFAMKTELIKTLKINFIAGLVWIIFDMLFYYHHHQQFSIEELKNAARPVAIMLTISIIYVNWKFRKK